ncbi:MAG: tetratricopeptide repeat protein [Nitrospira sp. CG24E]|mgnify:CR=1 FL=1|nr:MAG: tetratricopeptide repeat protein [Nitrospira sp. CG24E]
MAQNQLAPGNALELDRLATQLAKDPHSKAFMPLAEEYGKSGMWQEAAAVLEDGLKLYPGFITAMVALGRAYDQLGQVIKAKAILEESVKLSPENLRAHRTLIKIYQNQGLNESALQSCAVILAANPRDEEARSIQSALGGPLKQQKEPARQTSPAPATPTLSAQQATTPSAPVEFTAPTTEASIGHDLSVATPPVPEVDSGNPPIEAAESMLSGPGTDNRTEEAPTVPEINLPAVDRVDTPPSSPHADVVAQLEAWLCAIESRRLDRDATNESQPKVS